MSGTPIAWRTARLKNVATTRSGGTPDVSNLAYWADEDDPQGVAWVAIADMTRQPLLVGTSRRVTPVGLGAARLSVGQPGTLLFAMYASLGTIAVLDTPASWNQAILGVAARADHSIDFIRYSLMNARRGLAAIARSNTQANLNQEQVGNLPLLVPAPDVQRRVASFLDDECERIALASDSARGMYVRTLEQVEGWAATTMLVAAGRTDRIKFLVQPPVGGTWGSEPGGDEVDVSCARVADFDRESLRVEATPTVRSIARRDADRLRLASGDLLLEKSGGGAKSPVGFVAQFQGSDSNRDVVSSNFVARLRPLPENDSRYLTHLFGALYATRRNEAFVKQNTGIQNLDVAGYLSIRVPHRTHAEQVALAGEAQARRDATLALRADASYVRDALAEYRDSLIHEAVTGHLDVSRTSDAQMNERLHAATEGRLDEATV